MTRLLSGLATALAFGAVGFAAAGALAALRLAPNQGLAGPAIVAMQALGGFALGALTGGLLAWRAPPRWRRRALRAAGPVAAGLLVVAALGAWQARQAARDPESAYAGLPVYAVTLTRGAGADPVLARRVEIDAEARRWSLDMPDGRTCTGRLRAPVQARVGEALAAALADGPPRCAGGDDAPLTLAWRGAFGAGATGADAACRAAAPGLEGLIRTISMAPTLAESGADCR